MGEAWSPPLRLLILWLGVNVMGAVLATSGMPQVTSRVGDNLHLECLVPVENLPLDLSLLTVHWAKDGNIKATFENMVARVALSRLQLSVYELERGNASLVIGEVILADAGLYLCSVTYGNREMTSQMRLKVQGPKTRARIRHFSSAVEQPEEPMQRYLEVGMVLGVVVTACGVALVLEVCYKG